MQVKAEPCEVGTINKPDPETAKTPVPEFL